MFCCGRQCPLRRSCQPRQALFNPKTCPLGGLPPGSQGLGPYRVDRTSSRDGSFEGESGSSSGCFATMLRFLVYSFGGGSGGGSCVRLPSRGSVSTSRPRIALSCAKDISASKLAAAAFSASPAGSTLAVSPTRAGAVARPVALPLVRAC